MPLTLTSPAFEPMGVIPRRHTCEGGDYSPPLAWDDPPAGTHGFALIVHDPDAPDPDAPERDYVHWVLYDIPAGVRQLPDDADHALPEGTRRGINDWDRANYGGPCPPIGRHRYFHELYALDTVLGDIGNPTMAELRRAMEGHVLASAELVGTYQKGD